MLEDIAILTGGVVISEEKGLKLEQATLEMLGTCDKVTVTKDNTTIVNGAGDKQCIADRVAQLKNEIANTTSSYDKEKLQERLHHKLLRQGEAAGASGQDFRWRRSALRRREQRG